MQRSELIDAVAAKSRLDRHDAASAVDAVFDAIRVTFSERNVPHSDAGLAGTMAPDISSGGASADRPGGEGLVFSFGNRRVYVTFSAPQSDGLHELAPRAEARYHELVNRELANGLTPDERRELAELEQEFERAEEPLRLATERRDAEDQRRHEERMRELRRLNDGLDALLARLGTEAAV